MRVGQDGGGPVDQCPPVAVDEQVERVKVAVADDALIVSGGAEMLGDSRQVLPADGVRLCRDALEEVADVGLAGVVGEFAVEPVDRTLVECGGGFGEEVGESSKQRRGRLEGGGRAEPGE